MDIVGFNHLNMDINMDVNGNYWKFTNLLINNNQTIKLIRYVDTQIFMIYLVNHP